MTTISIQSAVPFPLTLLYEALNREKRILKNSIKTTHTRISILSKSLAIDPASLLSGTVIHTDENDMEFLEIEGELLLLQHLQDELAALESARICA